LPRYAPWCIALAAAVVLADLLSKLVLTKYLELDRNYWLIDPWVGLERTDNRGLAFGLGGDSRWVSFLVIAAVAGFGLLLLRSGMTRQPFVALAVAAMAGGAIGNLIDRLRDGVVTDFIVLGIWPRFNVADSALTVGIALLLWSEIVARPDIRT
jgi:signal peptidase II